MSEMTDERAAEVLAAHNGWRRYNGETGVPGAPEMGDPAELGHAIDHAVSRLRSQPPAEAQPVAWEWEYIGVDQYPRGHKVARALHEMDPQNPPYPETWRPTRPLVYGDAAPQQPAAVDGASPYPVPRNRREAAALARLALTYLGATSAHIEAAVARCETDLAAQQGEES